MRNPLPYGITAMPKTIPGMRVVQNPTLVRVQFQRRRARQLIKLIDGAVVARLSISYKAPSGLSLGLQA